MRSLQIYYVFCVLLLSLTEFSPITYAGTLTTKEPAGIKTGENWIQNQKVKVAVKGKGVCVHMKDVSTGEWKLLSVGYLHGLLKTKVLMSPYRKKYGGYYLFGKKSEVKELKTEIRDGSPVIRYRTSLEDLWIDTEIKILKDSSFVLVEAVAKSSDSLIPHWCQTFHKAWAKNRCWMPAMTNLIFDGKSIAAIDYRDRHKFPAFSRYCIACRPNEKKIWGFLRPPQEGKASRKKKMQLPPGAITIGYLDAPYVIFAEITDEEKNVEEMSRLGETLYKQMSSFLLKQNMKTK